jgi:DNA-binding NtrC family response regulator
MRSNEPEATANNQTSPHTILAVEDDAALCELLVQLVEQETPFHAVPVPDAEQALEAVRTITPSLFILDYQLPGIDGLELSDRLHEIEEFATIPTLMISAHPPSRKAMQQRHIQFLKKPFDLADLLQDIENLLPL